MTHHLKTLAVVLLLACGLAEGSGGRGIKKNTGTLSPPAFWKASGNYSSPVDTTLPSVPSQPWCLVWTNTAVHDWPDATTDGIWNMGAAWNAANGMDLYRFSSANQSIFTMEMYDSNGTSHVCYSGGNYPLGTQFLPTHTTAFCLDNNKGYFYADGALTTNPGVGCGTMIGASGNNLTTSIELGGLGANQFGDGTNNPPTSFCIATGTGNTGDPTVDVKNACKQFTTKSYTQRYDCYGCLGSTPAAGATKVLAIGDSITAFGNSSPRPYPAKLNALLGTGYDVTNGGEAGDKVADIKSRYDSNWHHASMFARCVFQGGVNDIMGAPQATGAATYTTASALLDEMRADGCNPIVVILPVGNASAGGMTWSAGQQTEWETYRTDLNNYCTTNSITCVDTYSTMGNGGSPVQFLSQYDSSDHVHPSQAGLDEIATLVKAHIP